MTVSIALTWGDIPHEASCMFDIQVAPTLACDDIVTLSAAGLPGSICLAIVKSAKPLSQGGYVRFWDFYPADEHGWILW